MNTTIHFFLNSNGSRGPVSFYDSNFGPLDRVVRLSGYPHAVLEELYQAVLNRAEQECSPAQVIHHCLDNTVQGIILPEQSAGILGFDVYDDNEPNILAALGSEPVTRVREKLKAAHELFGSARAVHDDWEKIYIENMDFDAANQLAEETITMLLDGKQTDRPGREVHRFFGAATIDGNLDYIANLTADIPKRYFIKGRPGTGKSTFLRKIGEAARQRGYYVEVCHCSFDPNSLDLIAVRELGFCLFDSTAPHEYFPSRPSDEIIDIYERAVTPGTDEQYSAQLVQLQNSYKEKVGAAAVLLREAKSAADEFDAALPEIDRTALEQVKETLLQKLFSA